MPTLIDLISDIELELSKGNLSDDFQTDRRQIRFRLDIERNFLLDAEIKKQGKSALESFLAFYPCVKIKKKKKECEGGCDEYSYSVKLPVSIAGLPDDMGLYRMETQSGVTVYRMKVSEKSRINSLRFKRPSSKDIFYFRIGTDVTLEGGTDNFKDNGSVNMWLIPESTVNLDDNDEFPINGNLTKFLVDAVVASFRNQNAGKEDEVNDGNQNQ